MLQRRYNLLINSSISRDGSSNSSSKGDDLGLRYQRKWIGNGGRFYSALVNLPKEGRLAITINGQSVGSWDFSPVHPTLLLLLLQDGVGVEPNMFSTGEVYSMPEYPHIPRSGHKAFINKIFNRRCVIYPPTRIGTATETLLSDSGYIKIVFIVFEPMENFSKDRLCEYLHACYKTVALTMKRLLRSSSYLLDNHKSVFF